MQGLPPASLMKGAEMRGSLKSWEMPRRELTSGSLAVSATLKYTMRTCVAAAVVMCMYVCKARHTAIDCLFVYRNSCAAHV